VRADAAPVPDVRRAPYALCALVGLGGLFYGVTGPLLSTFVPILVRNALGDQRTIIGAVMAIDNVLLLLLVPWAGVVSDRAANRGRSRLPLVLGGYALTAAGIALLPSSAALGLAGLIAVIVVLYSGLNAQRSPFQALLADLVPSRFRPLASGSVTFQMCVGAIVFLMLGRMLGMRPAFLIAAATVVGIGAAFAVGLREREPSVASASEATFRSLAGAAWSLARGAVPGLRTVFIASLLLQMIFQSFSTWFALHGTDRFGVRPEDVTLGFIAWAFGGVIGALPAGAIGVRIGRRNAILLGFALMLLSFIAIDRVTQLSHMVPLLMLASAGWTLPSVNAYPLFIEPIPRHQRGVLASLYLLAMALGGAVGDPLNGGLFDLAGGYRPLFLIMSAYTALAIAVVFSIPRGVGEADTGPDAA
jgi:MFS family permease